MRSFILLVALITAAKAFGAELRDYKPYKYEVLFTNPECGTFVYNSPLRTKSGKTVTQKPKNAYCDYNDSRRSGRRKNSPQQRLVDWIRDAETKTIHMSYLSFSNSRVVRELCAATKDRDVEITLYMDGTSEKAHELKDCNRKKVSINARGHSVGGAMGYHHNKLFMVNLYSDDAVKIAFSSGNMSSGTVLHHENWHFITTSPKTYFAQSHRCVMSATESATGRRDYKRKMDACQAKIKTEKELDIVPFFVPGDGEEAIKYIQNALYYSMRVDLAGHRFFLHELIDGIWENLRYDGVRVRMVFDDDTYWIGTGGLKTADRVDTMPREYRNAMNLVRQGATVHWLETNHSQHLLHHNKFLIFSNDYRDGNEPAYIKRGAAVFAGAGNFTNGAFKMRSKTTNYENYYYITIPEVVAAFKRQYEHLYRGLATPHRDMPVRDEFVTKQ